ncbi:MAG: hypothetical protein CME40_03970 [Haliea sp.]|nr:hypothetical protein [Haliea sp.]
MRDADQVACKRSKAPFDRLRDGNGQVSRRRSRLWMEILVQINLLVDLQPVACKTHVEES